MNPGDRIRQLRIAHNMTLEELGNLVGVGKSTVRKWETGAIANMRRDKIAKLAEALDTTVADIMGIEYEALPLNLQLFSGSVEDERHKLVNELFDRLPQEKQDLAIALLRGLSQSPADPDGK